jgi:HEAT repeat protein
MPLHPNIVLLLVGSLLDHWPALTAEEPAPLQTAVRNYVLTGAESPLLEGHYANGEYTPMPIEVARAAMAAYSPTDPDPHGARQRARNLPLRFVDQTCILVPTLTKAIQDLVDEADIHDAVSQLSRYGPEAASAIPALLPLLPHHYEAADALGCIGRRPDLVLDPLIARLDGPDLLVSMHAAEALASVGFIAQAPRIVPALVSRLTRLPPPRPYIDTDPDPPSDEDCLRWFIMRALRDIGWPARSTLPMMRGWLASEHPQLAVNAAEALCEITSGPSHDAAAIARIACADRSPEDRMFSERLIERLGADAAEAVPVLLKAWTSTDPKARPFLMRMMSAIGPAAGNCAPVVVETIKIDPHNGIPLEQLYELANLGDPGCEELNALIRAAPFIDDRSLIWIYQSVPEPAAAPWPAVTEILADGTPRMRRCGLMCLRAWMRRRSDLFVIALPLLSDADPTVRRAAIEVCGAAGPAAVAAIPQLCGLLTSDGPSTSQIVTALADIGSAVGPTVPAIAACLTHPEVAHRRAASRALARLGLAAQGAQRDLERLIEDPDPEVRRWSAAACCHFVMPTAAILSALVSEMGNSDILKRIDVAEAVISAGPAAHALHDQVREALSLDMKFDVWVKALLSVGIEPASDASLLAQCLDIQNESSAARALAACGIDQPVVLPALHRSCKLLGGLPHVRLWLVRLGDDPIGNTCAIAMRAMHGNREQRLDALDALAELGPLAEPARPWLQALVQDSDPFVAHAARIILDHLIT